jgi:hypothetical protein
MVVRAWSSSPQRLLGHQRADVARHVSASRRLIEIGRDSWAHDLDEIQRVRLESVCRCCARQPPDRRGRARCGFDSESHVSALFRRQFGCTMRDYRKTR